MSEQLLSADPAAGLLSTDPNAAAPPPAGYWEDRGVAGKVWHPANGANERTRVDNSVLGVPPELAATGIASVASAVGGAGLSAAQRAIAGAKAIAAQAAPTVKYELVRRSLEMGGIPSPIAIPLAMAISGYKKGASATTVAEDGAIPPPANPNAPHLDTSVPMRPSQMTQEQLGERIFHGTGTPPAPSELRGRSPAPIASNAPPAAAAPVSPVASDPVAPAPPGAATANTAAPPPTVESAPSAPRNQLPDQKALNEAALARRRAEYQARQAAADTAAVPSKPKLTAAEAPEYIRLIRQGETHEQAMKTIEAVRALRDRLGLPTPTAAEKQFPKGMRDYKTVSAPKTPAPRRGPE